MNVDFEARVITGGIRELALPPEPGAGGGGGFFQMRAAIGREIHQEYRLQRRDLSGFAAEVAVELSHEVDGFEVRLRGRIDGLFDHGDTFTIEEVKSVAQPAAELALLGEDDLPRYCLQARLYALALQQREPARAIAARLLLVSIAEAAEVAEVVEVTEGDSDSYRNTASVGSETREQTVAKTSSREAHRVLPISFDPVLVREHLDDRLRALIGEAEARRERGRLRLAWADRLRFPYDEPRPQQTELMERIAAGLNEGRPVLASAPTGAGKTVSALLPGLRFALASDAPLCFVTAKTTQRALAARTFIDIAEASGLEPDHGTAVTLRAKAGMCPPGHLVCHPDHCAHLADFARRAAEADVVGRLIRENLHVEPEVVYQLGESATLCPFELMLQAAGDAELIIGDYNHIYQPEIGPKSKDTSLIGNAVVIVDEAHNLFDRARGYESCFLGRAHLDRALEHLDGGNKQESKQLVWSAAEQLPNGRLAMARERVDAVAGALRVALGELFESVMEVIDKAALAVLGPLHVGELVEGCSPACDCCGRDVELWRDLAAKAARLGLRYVLYRRSQGGGYRDDPVLAALEPIGRIRDAVAANQPHTIPYVASAHSPRGAGFGVMCVDPASYLSRRHRRARGTVAMSATLEPLGYFADVLGLAELDPICTAVSSPFAPGHRRVMVVPTVDTSYRERGQYYRAIAELIADIVATREGRYAAFFPSFDFLARAREHLRDLPGPIWVQLPNMPPVLRDKIIERFVGSPGPALLCAVMGGVFAEGIDLPGDQLIGAIVVGPGLPAVGFERVLMQRCYEERIPGSGFDYAMLFPGMQRVVQAAGRVIRTAEDRGIIALLGRRFAKERYAACLPADWSHGGAVGDLIASDPVVELAEFWASFDDSDRLG